MDEKQMMHGENWRGEDLTGWIATEKFRGCRAGWDGSQLWCRGGDLIKAPAWITEGLPAGFPLDCEVWCGYDAQAENRAKLAVRYGKFGPEARLVVFDAPGVSGGYLIRLAQATKRLGKNPNVRAVIVHLVNSNRHAIELMAVHHKAGGEGLVCYKPTAPYVPGRTCNVLKVKE